MSEPIKLDVEAIVKARMGGKKPPRLLVRFLRHIVHEDIFNRFFQEHPDARNYEFIRETLAMLRTSASVEGEEKIFDTDNRLLFVSNHPMGGLDGMIIALMLAQKRGDRLRVIVNDLLMNLRPLEDIFVPVNRNGAQNREYALRLKELYDSEYDILTFPAGMCSRIFSGKVQDPAWQKNFIQKAIESKRDIIPIYFDGKNSRFFYNLALWRKRLGVKMNVEMLFLADEMFKAHDKHFKLYIGDKISYTTFDKTQTPTYWAQWVREKVYNLNPQTKPQKQNK